jgi:hypothetical protein
VVATFIDCNLAKAAASCAVAMLDTANMLANKLPWKIIFLLMVSRLLGG